MGGIPVHRAEMKSKVTVCCEHCQGQFTVEVQAAAEKSDWIGLGQIGLRDYQKQVREEVQAEMEYRLQDLGTYAAVRRCPKCGWLQSWQVDKARRESLRGAAVGIGCAVLFAIAVVAGAIWAGHWLSYAAGALVAVMVVIMVVTLPAQELAQWRNEEYNSERRRRVHVEPAENAGPKPWYMRDLFGGARGKPKRRGRHGRS
jgi:hypothetical protein